ncbi:MAG: YebC/PmpR family DNA-binding transcriptional regulator [Candidatus Paceibacterota bacterium]|jgi:YebC/PmpR family DNA-binding regulatory protein
MSGHNKFSKIKREKAKTDAQRSAVFTKVAKILQMEAKKANGNMLSPGLKSAIDKARAVDMPSDNIERAIKKAVGAGAEQMEEVTYEAYGPGGVALIIEGLTGNKNKAAAEIKHILSQNNTSLASSGSASWAFERTAEGWMPKTMVEVSEADAPALEKLIEDLENNEDVQEVYTNAE